jgi:hypothetical protein
MDEKAIDFGFDFTDIGEYQDMRIFPQVEKDYTGKERTPEEVAKAEVQVIGRLVEIATAVGDLKDIEKLDGSYSSLLVKLFQYIEKQAPKGLVNLKVVMTPDMKWTKVPNWGFIEKYVTGQDPKLYFSQREKDDKLDQRPVTYASSLKPTGSSDTASAPHASSVVDDSLPF